MAKHEHTWSEVEEKGWTHLRECLTCKQRQRRVIPGGPLQPHDWHDIATEREQSPRRAYDTEELIRKAGEAIRQQCQRLIGDPLTPDRQAALKSYVEQELQRLVDKDAILPSHTVTVESVSADGRITLRISPPPTVLELTFHEA